MGHPPLATRLRKIYNTDKQMKKFAFAAIAALMCLSIGASAQGLLRSNFMKNGYTYTSTERARVEGSTPLMLKLTKIVFPGGDLIYKMRVDYEDATSWRIPKNADFKAVNAEGRTVMLQNATEEPNAVAPKGFSRNGSTVYWNYGEYYMEQADLEKLLANVTSIDATKRFSSDGVISLAYKNNEFSSALQTLYDAIESAPAVKKEIGQHLKSVSDQNGNRLLETEQLSVSGPVNVALVYLYYAASNSENYDLNLYLQGTTVPYGKAVTLTTPSGAMEFSQEKELPAGRVIVYPTIDQLKALAKSGASKLTVQTVNGPVSFNIDSKVFADAINTLYNSLQTATIL